MARCLLVAAALPDTFWCFALQYAVFIDNNFYHTMTKQIPIHHFNGGSVALPPTKTPIFGSKMRIIK